MVVDTLGSTLGTVHVGKQDLSSLVLKRPKALKQLRKEDDQDKDHQPDDDDDAEKNKRKKTKVVLEPTDI